MSMIGFYSSFWILIADLWYIYTYIHTFRIVYSNTLVRIKTFYLPSLMLFVLIFTHRCQDLQFKVFIFGRQIFKILFMIISFIHRVFARRKSRKKYFFILLRKWKWCSKMINKSSKNKNCELVYMINE